MIVCNVKKDSLIVVSVVRDKTYVCVYREHSNKPKSKNWKSFQVMEQVVLLYFANTTSN